MSAEGPLKKLDSAATRAGEKALTLSVRQKRSSEAVKLQSGKLTI